VRPRLDETFRRNEKMGIYLQLYNFQPDEATKKLSATVEYEVVRNGSNARIFNFAEELAQVEGASATQTVIEKILPLQNLEPGEYTLKMKVTDKVRNESLTREAIFKVN
jgi:hypothetical protein